MSKEAFNRTVYTLNSFKKIDVADWGNLLKEHHLECMHEEASYPQRKAWFDCFTILQRELCLLPLPNVVKERIYIIFEYQLPRERGRRPDVLLLSGTNLIVLEFKGYSYEDKAHIDQVKHYARDLRNYHEKSHELNVVPILILAAAKNILHITEGVEVVSGDNLHLTLEKYLQQGFNSIEEWFGSEYAPLPSLLQSAQMLFREKQFPQIKKAQSAGIPETLAKLKQIAETSQHTQSHHLALITGVPGAGKTLVGLQFVFETYKQDQRQKAVFLSGNGPLVEVLQTSLSNKNFVQSVHGFLKQYAHSTKIPSEDVIIYDEAQRAWDSDKVANSNRQGNNSEPTDFINIGDKMPHCLLIGLIGEGQEIYLGEESGMVLWSEAINQSSNNWIIHCPEKLKDVFPGKVVHIEDAFNLTTSLRTHQAVTLQDWVMNLLDNNILKAKELYLKLQEEDYPIYITRDLEIAKKHLKNKYDAEPEKTYGLIASSKSKILPNYGVNNGFDATKLFTVSHYFVDISKNAYCRNLNNVVTECGSQGLELDMPILAWDADWVYENKWVETSPNKKAQDSYKLRKNCYRVLLTRGRDGMVIFVPMAKEMNSTFEYLLAVGCNQL
jgi:hypothetical protein